MGRRRKNSEDPAGYELDSLERVDEQRWEARLRYIGTHKGPYSVTCVDHTVRMVIAGRRTRKEAERYVREFIDRRRLVNGFNNRMVDRQ